ncbi:Rieske (2Fe-2S) protein [Archangium violaceum]|uniref:(2Fe-2S)-binding protein n=1 Tax=Archangium violaceum Cb vi76 TaxID=1406225 RepID=A0A084SZ09_9BACT|nr:Rieske 2Fe-2S domain-containing protein [Archangium violaceum]KFA93694.1 (2Fe-2S)-binding protein [Archangium violaceum Cb vi76]WNG59060.1 Rieske 2Fe-2S domain-containing protein [Archangium gephyra]WPB81048.1 Rieske 2Fe-2S domain-containing protein [Archangium gephyra]
MNGQEDEHFIPVAHLSDLDERGRAVVRVGEEWVALVQVDGRLHAVQQACPHRGGPMSEGDQDGCLLYCPLHAWAFDVRTGISPTIPGARVRIYPVRVIGDEIQVAASDRVPVP